MRKAALLLIVSALAAACAARPAVMPPAPPTPRYPDFLYPVVAPTADSIQITRIERGWRYLQANSLGNAEREFQAALKLQPSFHPAETALGYLELARGDEKDAAVRFDRALEGAADYVPALVGRGRALLALGREGEALASFEAAVKYDASLTDLQARIEVLRFRAVQDNLKRARAFSDAGRWEEARAAYGQALAASPDSAFLYRDLASVERKAGENALAIEHFRKAVSLDPSDARSLVQIASILDEQGDVPAALEAYEKAAAVDPGEVPAERVAALRESIALARLPAEYRAIGESATATRGAVAALIGVRLAPLLAQARTRQAVVTDIRTHWAQQWILPVVRAGIMDTQPNYTFQPEARVRRGDLAQTVARLLNLIAARNPAAAKAWQGSKIKIADLSASHLSYPAVAQAVASGVMPLADNGTFQLLRAVTGAEAIEVIGRLEALAKP
jgi:tetratricopeptide (TPR) repeat protein